MVSTRKSQWPNQQRLFFSLMLCPSQVSCGSAAHCLHSGTEADGLASIQNVAGHEESRQGKHGAAHWLRASSWKWLILPLTFHYLMLVTQPSLLSIGNYNPILGGTTSVWEQSYSLPQGLFILYLWYLDINTPSHSASPSTLSTVSHISVNKLAGLESLKAEERA